MAYRRRRSYKRRGYRSSRKSYRRRTTLRSSNGIKKARYMPIGWRL